MVKRIVIFGKQGSGKGTQAQKLIKEFNFVYVSTGVILREAKMSGMRSYSDSVKHYLENDFDRGILAADEIVNEIIKKRLVKVDAIKKGYILDGYPRTIEQANFLDSIDNISDVVFIDITDEEAVRRISGRLMTKSGKTYHKIYNPPPADLDEEIFSRVDDKEEVVRERLKIYHEKTEPILKLFEARGILRKINGEQSIDNVYRDIKKVLGF